jgi:putative endonuclease
LSFPRKRESRPDAQRASLVWFEEFSDIHDAIQREKRIKKWRRAWKLELIEKSNPGWKDFFC